MKKSYSLKLEGKEWKDCLKESYNKKKKDIKMDGFRKGLVPYEVYTKKAGIESLFMDAMDLAVDKLYSKLLEDPETITPAATPSIDIKNITEHEVEVEFTLVSSPEVKIGKYKNLGVKKDEIKVSKKEIDEEVAKLASRLAEIIVKEDGEVVEGNTAVIDFEGFVDGKPLEGGSGQNFPLEIGSHTFIPGFEEGLVGMKVGQDKELNLKFPEEYTKELAGKDVKFNVTVREIKERVLPELDKDFYQDLGFDDIDNEEDFRKEVKKAIEDRKE